MVWMWNSHRESIERASRCHRAVGDLVGDVVDHMPGDIGGDMTGNMGGNRACNRVARCQLRLRETTSGTTQFRA